MSMTVARRNRVWTDALRAEFITEVEGMQKTAPTRSKAFSNIGHKWGLSAGSAATLYSNFRNNKSASGKPFTTIAKRSYAPATSLKDESGNIQSAITLLKKMGATITF